MLLSIKDILQCPVCHGKLLWSNEEVRNNKFIVNSDIICSQCQNKYFFKDEIGYFLTDLERNDLWGQDESNLMKYLHEHKDIETNLMNSEINDLTPADLFFRSFVHEEREEFEIADELSDKAQKQLYTKEFYDCFQNKIKNVSDLDLDNKLVLDIASGKGYLVFELLKHHKGIHVIMTDFSPTIMQLNHKKLLHYNLLDRVSLLVFDARKTPFKSNSIDIMTSNVGLNNIQKPQGLLLELKRILQKDFYSIMHFFPEEDIEHKKFISENNMSELNFLDSALQEFKKANFSVELLNKCETLSKPTPEGKIIEGQIDGLPIHDTTMTWFIVHAR